MVQHHAVRCGFGDHLQESYCFSVVGDGCSCQRCSAGQSYAQPRVIKLPVIVYNLYVQTRHQVQVRSICGVTHSINLNLHARAFIMVKTVTRWI